MNPRRALVFLLVLSFALATAYSLVVPLGEASDEVSHWSYIRYVSMHQRLPIQAGEALGESHQPPLYYLLGALASFWIPDYGYQPMANPDFSLSDPQAPNVLLHTRSEAFPYSGIPLAWHLVRLLSVLMGTVTVWAAYQIALIVLPRQEWIAFGAAAFVAFLPEFIFISAVVNNDNLVTMLSTLGVLQTLRVMQRGAGWKSRLVLGALVGLALLAKLSGLVLWCFVAGCLLFRAYQTRAWKEYALTALLVFGVAIALALPWMAYNSVNYSDPLGWSLVLAATPVRQTAMSVNDWVWWLEQMYTSFWGRFGGVLLLRMNDAVYWILGLVSFVALMGWVLKIRDGLKKGLVAETLKPLAFFTFFWLIMLAAHIRWTLTVEGTDQARQLFPGIALLGLVLSAGIASLLKSRERLAMLAWAGGGIVLAVAVLIYLASIFAAPLQSLASLRPLGGKQANFGQAIRVADYSVDRMRVAPGGTIQIEVYWQALSDLTDHYWLLLQLAGNEGVIANRDGVPSSGRLTTDLWKRDQVFISHHSLIVPEDAKTGTYMLRLGLHPPGRWDWLPVAGQDTLELAKIVVTSPQ